MYPSIFDIKVLFCVTNYFNRVIHVRLPDIFIYGVNPQISPNVSPINPIGTPEKVVVVT